MEVCCVLAGEQTLVCEEILASGEEIIQNLFVLTKMSKILPLVSSRRLNHPELELCDGLHDKDQRLEIYGVGEFVSLSLFSWLMMFFFS